MIKATINDKNLIVDILTQAFESNQSVNYIIPQDAKRKQRIKRLMEYSFDVCSDFGEIFLSDDRKACALIILPDKKKSTIKSTLRDVKFILTCTGFGKVKQVLQREEKIKSKHPSLPFYHLWYIGVHPNSQGEGIGQKLLTEVIDRSRELNRPVYLETSTVRNIPFYKRSGFETFDYLEFTYKLHLLRLPFSLSGNDNTSASSKTKPSDFLVNSRNQQ